MSTLTSILQADRARCNAKFAAARAMHPGISGDEWLLILREIIAPIVEATAQQMPHRAGEVGEALYDAGLELLGRDLIGPRARHPLINAGWKLLLPSLALPLTQNPRRTIALVSNALHSLAGAPGSRPAQWIERVKSAAPLCDDVEMLAQIGFVVAWRCGLAHYRPRALELLAQLPPQIAATAVHRWKNSEAWAATLENFTRDPWFDPNLPDAAPRELRVQAIVGSFSGFGGAFARPPRVTRFDGRFWVADGQAAAGSGWRLLSADIFGATIESRGAIAMFGAPENEAVFELKPDGKVLWSGEGSVESVDFPQLAGAGSWAADQSTLVAAIPVSHGVYIVARTAKPDGSK